MSDLLNEDSGVKCDACDKCMQKYEECWVIKTRAPFDCTGYGFCLCLACYTGPGAASPLSHVEATLTAPVAERASAPKAWKKMPEGYWVHRPWAAEPESAYKFRAYEISGCKAHGDLSDHVQGGDDSKPLGFATTCRCRCALCDRPGRARVTSSHSELLSGGTEAEWYVGEVTAFGDVHFYFLVCPACVPDPHLACVSGCFSDKWFVPHLKRCVLSDHYNC